MSQRTSPGAQKHSWTACVAALAAAAAPPPPSSPCEASNDQGLLARTHTREASTRVRQSTTTASAYPHQIRRERPAPKHRRRARRRPTGITGGGAAASIREARAVLSEHGDGHTDILEVNIRILIRIRSRFRVRGWCNGGREGDEVALWVGRWVGARSELSSQS